MSDKIAVRVNDLGKKYSLGGPNQSYYTIRDVIVNSLKAPFNILHQTSAKKEFWALKKISFEVKKGEVIGIIGRNGAGKSTLLKILSRITTPTEGTVEIHGRIGSLLEVGTGFHPELTGRENIFLSGSILGMKKSEINEKFDEIVKFSEIEKFLDTPAKRYSSGMYVRLAFSVAAHLEPEILLVDEVLAVGDVAFQKKCLGKMSDVSKEGKTVLFVSHNMQAVNSLCQKTIFIENGQLGFYGNTNEAIKRYIGISDEGQNNLLLWIPQPSDKIPFSDIVKIERFSIQDQNGNIISGILNNSMKYDVVIEITLLENDPRLIFGLFYYSEDNQILFSTDIHDNGGIDFRNMKKGKVTFKIPIPVDMLVTDKIYEIELTSILHLTTWILAPGNATRLRFKFFRIINLNPFNYEKNLANLIPIIKWEVIESN